jgi:RNA methyltransferase, TrmH family
MARNLGVSTVTTEHDPRLARLRHLRVRAYRERTGHFFTEGVRFVSRALAAGAAIETVVVAPRMLESDHGWEVVERLKASGTPVLEVAPGVFRDLSLAEEPQGVAAVVRQWWEPLGRVAPDAGLCWVALESVRAPGNLGTVLRTCEAVGAAGVMLLGDTTDPYDPATVRASMGSLFSQRLVRTTAGELAAWKTRHGVTLAGTSPSAREDYHQYRYPSPVVLLMGSERRGLSSTQQRLCDVLVRVPMAGGVDSLNLAVATSVILYEVFNQRRGS